VDRLEVVQWIGHARHPRARTLQLRCRDRVRGLRRLVERRTCRSSGVEWASPAPGLGKDFPWRCTQMPRTMWKGAISFGLVPIPIRLYPATEEKTLKFNQLHDEDHGRIKYQRVCAVDGQEVPFEHIVTRYA